MRDFIIRAVINAIAISIAAYVLPGIEVANQIVPLLIIGAIITLVNALIKPIITLLSCPFVILTLGLFVLVINGIVLQIAATFAGSSFVITDFWTAFFAGIIMAIVNMFLESIFGVEKKKAD